MRVQTRHTPAFGVARVLLDPGEAVQAAPETLLASRFGVTETPAGRGGVRASKSTTAVYTAPSDGGWIDFAPLRPGDVYPLELRGGTGWSVHRDAVLVRPSAVRHGAR